MELYDGSIAAANAYFQQLYSQGLTKVLPENEPRSSSTPLIEISDSEDDGFP